MTGLVPLVLPAYGGHAGPFPVNISRRPISAPKIESDRKNNADIMYGNSSFERVHIL